MSNMFNKVLAEVAGAFESFKRDGSETEIWRIKDGSPEWLKDFSFMHGIHKALDDRSPDDWVYEHTSRIANSLTDYTIESADDARDNVHEIADGMVDIYNADRLRWLASHLFNADLCDEAVSESGVPADASMIDRIGAGQYLALERMTYALIDAIESEADSRGEDAEDE